MCQLENAPADKTVHIFTIIINTLLRIIISFQKGSASKLNYNLGRTKLPILDTEVPVSYNRIKEIEIISPHSG